MTPHRWQMDQWRETFVLQARLHEVPGPQIGDALAEVDAHCTDSGQDPGEAFGDPADYAAALARDGRPVPPAHPSPPGRLLRRPWMVPLSALAVLSGLFALLEGVRALAQGTRGVVTIGQVAAVVVGTVAVTVVGAVILRPGRRHLAVPMAVTLVAGFGLMMYAQLTWDQPVLRTPGWGPLVAGVVLLALAWWPLVSGRALGDRIRDPRTGADRVPAPRWFAAFARWGLPAATVLVGVTLVLLLVLVPAG